MNRNLAFAIIFAAISAIVLLSTVLYILLDRQQASTSLEPITAPIPTPVETLAPAPAKEKKKVDFSTLPPSPIVLRPSEMPLDKSGEDVSPNKLGEWRSFQANPLTLKEKKTRPFWPKLTYHGGWNWSPGHQAKVGSFRLANPFGVWEHDPKTDNLLFKFAWPYGVESKYDVANDSYRGIHTNQSGKKYLLFFTVDDNFKLQNVQVEKVPFERYSFTDAKKRAWFTGKRGEVLWNDSDYHRPAVEAPPKLSFRQANQQASKLYRQRRFHLQEYSGGDWIGARLPFGVRGAIRSVDQSGDVLLLGTNNGTIEWHYLLNITFLLSKRHTHWTRFDKDGRKWLSVSKGVYYLPSLESKQISYSDFVETLPQILSTDQAVATASMRRLLLAGPSLGAWVEDSLASGDEDSKAAASLLQRAISGQRTLRFSGESESLERLIAGEGIEGERLPLPAKNVENTADFTEDDPLILNSRASGRLQHARLTEVPLVDYPGYTFRHSAQFLASKNQVTAKYYRITHDDTSLRALPVEAPLPFLFTGKTANPNEAIVQVYYGDSKRNRVGLLNIDSQELKALVEIPRSNPLGGQMHQDSEGRMLIISSKGRIIRYQRVPQGALSKLEVSRPMMPAGAGVVMSPKSKKTFVYRGTFQKQWEGRYSEIFEFREGSLIPIKSRIPNHIYNISFIDDRIMIFGSRDFSRKIHFIDSHNGKTVQPPFAITEMGESVPFFISGIHDRQGRFWFHTVSTSNQRSLNRIQRWDGETLVTIVDWEGGRVINPWKDSICLGPDGIIWVGLRERMLLIDSLNSSYRFFRVRDRKKQPKVYSLDARWIAADYLGSPTAFHLELGESP